MAEGIISNLPPEFSRRDELAEDALDPRRYEDHMCRPGYLVGGDREYGDFLRHFVWLAQRDGRSRSDAKRELASTWETQPDELPWPTPSGVDYGRIANALVEDVWPTPNWSEGSVDTSEMHILVVHGGCLDEEPEAVDVALIGPDDDDGVIVEFLPMTDVDAEAAETHRRYTVRLVSSRAHREPRPWRSLLRHCWSTSNAYGPTRFDLRLGRRPLQHWPRADRRTAGLVTKQPRCVEGIGPLGRYKVYNKVAYVGIELARGNETLKGWIVWLDEDSVAVVLRWPFRGGCVCRTISESDENGRLVNDEGHLNGYGLQVVVDLLNDMYRAAVAMEERLSDIKRAMRTVYESISAERARIGPSVDARLRAIWRAVPGPQFNFDIAFFKSGLHAWGTENPGYFDNDVWWVHE